MLNFVSDVYSIEEKNAIKELKRMSFSSSRSSRTVKRACTEKHSFTNVLTSTGGVASANKLFKQGHSDGAVRKSEAFVASIGGWNAKGLNIIGGGVAMDYSYPSNPDGHGIPMEKDGDDAETGLPKDRLFAPPFPVSYQGPGYLKFLSPFACPGIIGNFDISGDVIMDKTLHVEGNLTVGGTVTAGASTVPFSPAIEDDLGGTLTGVTTTSSFYTTSNPDFLQVCISWTGKTLTSGSDVRLVNMPFTSYSASSFVTVVPDTGISTKNVGASVWARGVVGADYLEFVQTDTTSADPMEPLTGFDFDNAGSLCICGHVYHL